MLKVSDRYVFLEWLKVFVMVVASMFGLLIIFEIQDSFSDLLSFDASTAQIFQYYLVLAPSLATIVVPASVLVSILYALGQLHRNNELIAFRAAGMSVFRTTRSVWLACSLLSICLWFLNSSLIPWSVEESDRLIRTLEHKKEAERVDGAEVGLVHGLAFDNRQDNRMWFMNRYSQFLNQAYGVTVSIMDEERHELRRIMARRAYFDDPEVGWTFIDGREIIYDLEDDEKTTFSPFAQKQAPELKDDPELMLLLGKRPKDLSFLQLKRITSSLAREENPKVLGFEVRLHALMASAASCLIVAGIAIPFAVAGVRVNPAVGVAKSIGLFFAFYLINSIFNSMGRQGALSPAFAAWSPMILMIVLSYVFVRRVR